MAYRIIWSRNAADALIRATEYIAIDSPRHAQEFRLEAVSAARSLRHSPLRGRFVPEVPGTANRELFVRRYRLIYRVDADNVEILRFIHAARDLRNDTTVHAES